MEQETKTDFLTAPIRELETELAVAKRMSGDLPFAYVAFHALDALIRLRRELKAKEQ